MASQPWRRCSWRRSARASRMRSCSGDDDVDAAGATCSGWSKRRRRLSQLRRPSPPARGRPSPRVTRGTSTPTPECSSTHDTSGTAPPHLTFNATAVGGYRLTINALDRRRLLAGERREWVRGRGRHGRRHRHRRTSPSRPAASRSATPAGSATAAARRVRASPAAAPRDARSLLGQRRPGTHADLHLERLWSARTPAKRRSDSANPVARPAAAAPAATRDSPGRTQSSDGHFVTVSLHLAVRQRQHRIERRRGLRHGHRRGRSAADRTANS